MHFGLVTVPFRSHFNVFSTLGLALENRGHRVTFFHQYDAAALISDGLRFEAVGSTTHPEQSLSATIERAAHPRSFRGLRHVIDDMASTTAMLCAELPSAIERNAVDALIVDQMEPAGGLVASLLNLPFVSLACALPINRQHNLPLPIMPFEYRETAIAQKMYQGSARVYDLLMKPQDDVVAKFAHAFGLKDRNRAVDCLSDQAQVSQTTEAFDLPRAPGTMISHVGPIRTRLSRPATLPFVLSRRPFVYASLGTLQGHRFALFKSIAKACKLIGCDLLIAHCGRLNDDQCRSLSLAGVTWVVDFTNQREVLERASAVITHGGLNTVMDAIGTGTPMVVIPLAFDQHGVAARITHHRLGIKVSPSFASGSSIARALTRVMADAATKSALCAQRVALAGAGGTSRACEIIARAVGCVDRVTPGSIH